MTSKINKILLSKKNTYKIFDDNDYALSEDFFDKVAQIVKNGVDVIELRLNKITVKEFIDISKKIRDLSAYFDTLLFIYDRIDVAKIIDADGVVLSDNTITPYDAKKIIEDSMLIGFDFTSNVEFSNFYEDYIDFALVEKDKSLNLNIKEFST